VAILSSSLSRIAAGREARKGFPGEKERYTRKPLQEILKRLFY